jgi:hypothetical protein
MSFAETKSQREPQEAARDAVDNVIAPIAAGVPADEKVGAGHLRTISEELAAPGYVPPRTINDLGSEDQKRRWLPRLFSGEWISTAAITEPQAGSDMRGFTTSDRQAAGRSRTGRWFAPSTRRPRPEREGTCRKS